jgi:hypothetical protein
MPVMRDVPLPQTAEHRLTRHRRMVLAALLAVAALVRLCVYLELRDGPCLELHRWAESDMHYFHAWGSAIAEGDVLSQSIEPPLHQWHLQIARAAMHADADLGHEVAAAARANGKSRERELWTRWCGFRCFYQEPLYPYLLGAIYALCGNDPALVVWLQMLAGLAALAAVFWLTERYFGLLAATCAGGMTGLCGTLVHHEMLLLRETLLVLCGLLLVLLFERCRDVASNQRRLLFGVLASCALLLKFSFAPLARDLDPVADFGLRRVLRARPPPGRRRDVLLTSERRRSHVPDQQHIELRRRSRWTASHRSGCFDHGERGREHVRGAARDHRHACQHARLARTHGAQGRDGAAMV